MAWAATSADEDPEAPRSTVGFDEAGNTGPDLLNQDQPVFVLASVALPEGEASDLLGLRHGDEHHSVNDRKSRPGRERMLAVLSAQSLDEHSVKVAVMHKPFIVTTKIVDMLIEPIAAQLGLDLYQDGMHVGLSNLLHASWPVLDRPGFDRLSGSFVTWARRPTVSSARALAAAIRPMTAHMPEAFDKVLMEAARILEFDPTYLAGASDISDLDPAGPALLGLVHEWCAQLDEFDVVHDDSKEIKHWIPHVRRLSDPARPPAEFQMWNGHVVRYPLKVRDIALAPSESSAQIQLADLIAGAASIGFASYVRPPKHRLQAFASEVRDGRLPSWVIGASIWPTTDFGPQELAAVPGQTEWVIDRMANWGA